MLRQFSQSGAGRIAGLVAVQVVLLGGCATANAETMTIYNVSSDDSYVTLGGTDGIGDKILWNSEVQTESGDVIGNGAGHCTQLDAEQNFFCSFVITLDDRGKIAGQGVQRTEPLKSTFPILSGTGEFEGITGTMYTRPVEDRARFLYELDYQVPTAK
ncbi:MAG: hypothetical protein AAFY82_00525 [Pseudomonadota bacterium]